MALFTMTHRDSFVQGTQQPRQEATCAWVLASPGHDCCWPLRLHGLNLAAAPGRGGGGGWHASLGWGRTKPIAYLGWREEFGFYGVTGKMNSDGALSKPPSWLETRRKDIKGGALTNDGTLSCEEVSGGVLWG